MRVESSLVEAACRGDSFALDKLLSTLQPDLKRFARRTCATSEDAEDAVQITLWKLQRQIGTLRALSALASWTFRVVERECFRLFHIKRREVELSDAIEQTLCSAPVPHQLRHDLVQAIATLPMLYREVLVLRDIDELTAPETASALGISVDAVKSRLHRARALMRERLLAGSYWKADLLDEP